MSTKKFPPHKRLRKLRALLDLTQKEFAQLCGYNEQYILMIETGQRGMSPAVVEKACGATGVDPATRVDPLWLSGKEGIDSEPLTEIGEPYNPAEYQRKRASTIKMDSEPSRDQLSDIHHLCHELTTLMQAACRRRRFGMAKFYFRQMADAMATQLNLKAAIKSDRVDVLLRYLFSYQPEDSIYQGDFKREQREELWQLVSPSGGRAWARSFAGIKTEGIELLNELDRLRELVEESLVSRPARNPKIREKLRKGF